MHRPRHRRRSSARPAFLLLSVLALLAFACFPVFAQADGPTQYETEIPDVPTETKKHNSIDEPDAGKSNDGGNAAPSTPETEDESESLGGTGGNQGSGGGNGSGGANANNGGGTGQGSPGNGSNGGEKTSVGGNTPVVNPAQPVDDGGSSSPLVPILIAVAVLAAISIGAVVIRQRRQGGGSGGQVSPTKAS